MSTTTSKKRTTTVNGIGMYESWKRNFKTPFYAMLDLVDNAIDAALEDTTNNEGDSKFKGRVHIYEQHLPKKNVNGSLSVSSERRGTDPLDDGFDSSDDDEASQDDPDPVIQMLQKMEDERIGRKSDLVVVNNSFHKICPLKEILEIHKSAKGKAGSNKSEAIGENGVGLKQGCAALSNLSFAFVRNKDDDGRKVLSCGIIAKSLQHEHGCYLPSFDIDIDRGVKESLIEQLNHKDMGDVVACIAEYGLGSKKNGILRLTQYMEELLDDTNVWGPSKHVFMLVISDVMDKESSESKGLLFESSDSTPSNRVGNQENYRKSPRGEGKKIYPSRFNGLMMELGKKLPKHYIHIPDTEKFKLLINSGRIYFNFWQRRMIELMKFEQGIDENELFEDVEDITQSPEMSTNVRVFCGFDPERLDDEKQQKSLSLYIYSRRSGRLIKHEPDARNMLKLTAGGTDFAQGLTCIIDDFNGRIPLNPTKQDVAFSEKRNGEIMRQNLFAWTGGIVHLYYSFAKKKFLNERKGDLTVELKEYQLHDIREKFPDDTPSSWKKLPLLAKADLATIEGMKWSKFFSNNEKKIRARIVEGKVIKLFGTDTLFHLVGNLSTSKKKKKRKTPTKISSLTKSSPRPKKKVRTEKITISKTRRPRKKIEIKDKVTIDEGLSDSEDTHDEDFALETEPLNDDEDEQILTLKQQLVREKNINAKQKHDYDLLMNSKTDLETEKQREIDELNAKLEQDVPMKRDEDYEMMEEVKNNLQDENERLEEERTSLIEDKSFLNEKVKVLEKKLEAEKSVRQSLENEVELLKKELSRKN